MKIIHSLTLVSAFLWATSVMAAGDVAAGKQKSAACAACHGVDGNSSNAEWPKLAGQNPQYLYKQLMDYKENRRENALMAGQVAALSDQDMQDLAAYFSSQAGTPGSVDPAYVALGETVYRGGNLKTGVAACSACHGPTGVGNPAAKFPKISGQHSVYVKQQLLNYRDEQRRNDPSAMMRNIASKMSVAEIEAVSNYVSGLY